jgi:hypothetical protein
MESMFLRNVDWLSPVYTAFISPKVAQFIVTAVRTSSSTLLKELRKATKISVTAAGLQSEIRTRKFPNTKQAATFGLTISKFK